VLTLMPQLTPAMPSQQEMKKLINDANVKHGKKKKTQCSVCEIIVENVVKRLQGPVNETESELEDAGDDEAINNVLKLLQNPCVGMPWRAAFHPGAYVEGCNNWIDKLIKLHEEDQYHIRTAFLDQVIKATAKKPGERILDMEEIYKKVCIVKTKVCKKGRAMELTPPPMEPTTGGGAGVNGEEKPQELLLKPGVQEVVAKPGVQEVVAKRGPVPAQAWESEPQVPSGADLDQLAVAQAKKRAQDKNKPSAEDQARLKEIAQNANRFANQGGFEKHAERYGEVDVAKKFKTQCEVCEGVTKEITKSLEGHLKAGAKHPVSQSLGEICNLNSRRFTFNDQTPGTQLMACHRWVEAWDDEDMMENMMLREAAEFAKGGEGKVLDPEAMANEACHVRTDVCVKAAEEAKKDSADEDSEDQDAEVPQLGHAASNDRPPQVEIQNFGQPPAVTTEKGVPTAKADPWAGIQTVTGGGMEIKGGGYNLAERSPPQQMSSTLPDASADTGAGTDADADEDEEEDADADAHEKSEL